MNGESSGEQGPPRGYSRNDRLSQLAALAEACAGAGDLFGQHGPQDWGRAYRSVAAEARRLMVEDFGNEDLRELAVSVPGRLPWMHPKYADYNAPRQPWQEEAAQYVADAERLALELRSVAFYDE